MRSLSFHAAREQAQQAAIMAKVEEPRAATNLQDDEEEEVEIYRGPSSPPLPGDNGTVLRFDDRNTAIEVDDGTPEPEVAVTMKSRMVNFFRMPNHAIKETWSRLDLPDLPDELTEMLAVDIEQESYGECREGKWCKLVHDTLFGSNTVHGQVAGIILLILITSSVFLATMDSVRHIRDEYGDVIYGFEILFTVIFSIEYLLRVWCLRRPGEYVWSAMGIVDLASIIPTYITFMLDEKHRQLADLATLRIFRVIRVFRVLRLVRFVDAARALKDNIDANKLRVAVFMFFVFSMIIVIGCTMYLIEGEPNGFSNIPVSLYWAVVTLTTVGYGDIAPLTVPGRLLAAVVMFAGYGVIACPLVLNTQTEEEALRLNCECVRCYRGLHQDDANFCRHCGTALRMPKEKARRLKKKKSAPLQEGEGSVMEASPAMIQKDESGEVTLSPPQLEPLFTQDLTTSS